MIDFIAHVLVKGSPKQNFRAILSAESYEAAAKEASEGIITAYEKSGATNEQGVFIVLLRADADVLPQAWLLSLPSKELAKTAVPCGICGGSGGIDSGGVDPQNNAIVLPCPACSMSDTPPVNEAQVQLEAWQKAFGTTQLTHALARLEKAERQSERQACIIGDVDKGGNHRPECRCDKCYADLIDRASLGTEAQSFKQAFQGLQDRVWASLDRYSKKLGWGLLGVQPDCWICLDSAIDELVNTRKLIKEIRKALCVPGRHSDDNIPSAARELMDRCKASQPD